MGTAPKWPASQLFSHPVMAILFFGGYDEDSPCDKFWDREIARYTCFVFWVLSHHLLRLLLRRFWSFQLSQKALQRGQTKEAFITQAAVAIQSSIVQSILGPIAFYLSYSWSSVASVSETIVLHANISATSCEYYSQGSFWGSVYAGWAMYQVVQVACGWEKGGWIMWVHHLLFAFLGLAVPYLFVLSELTLFALAMEISTPFLEFLLTFRELEGHQTLTKVASLLFAVTFLFTRIFYFGYGLYRSLMFWHAPAPEALAALGDRATAVQALQGLFFLGWIVQLVWAKTLVSKLVGLVVGKGKHKSKVG